MNQRISTSNLRLDEFRGVYWCVMVGFRNGLGFMSTAARIEVRTPERSDVQS